MAVIRIPVVCDQHLVAFCSSRRPEQLVFQRRADLLSLSGFPPPVSCMSEARLKRTSSSKEKKKVEWRFQPPAVSGSMEGLVGGGEGKGWGSGVWAGCVDGVHNGRPKRVSVGGKRLIGRELND